MSNIGFKLDRAGYRTQAQYDKALYRFNQLEKMYDEYQSGLEAIAEKEGLSNKKLCDIQDYFLDLIDPEVIIIY